jgi:hypothetical protein
MLTEFFTSMPGILLIVVGGWVVIGGIVVIATTTQNRRMAALAEEAASRGWTYERERQGRRTTVTLSGETEGVRWRIDAVYVRSSSSSGSSTSFTRWTTEAVTLPNEAVFVGPPFLGKVPDSFDMTNPLVKFGVRMTLRSLLEDNPGDLSVFDRIYMVRAGTDSFNERYSVMATDEGQAREFVQAVESPLLDWALGHKKNELPTSMYWGHGLLVKFNDRYLDMAHFDPIVQLGARLAEAVEGDQGW